MSTLMKFLLQGVDPILLIRGPALAFVSDANAVRRGAWCDRQRSGMDIGHRPAQPLELIAHQAVRGAGVSAQLASLTEAVASGADRIELDVLLVGDRLLVAHDLRAARRGEPLELASALATVAAARLPVLLDIKGRAGARALGEYLAMTDWAGRTVLAGDPEDVELAGSLSGARRAWTLPASGSASAPARLDAHAGWLGSSTARARRRVAAAAVSAIRAGHTDDVCVDRRFATHALACGVHAAGGRVLVWTVDRPRQARRLADMGVDALITNRPAAIRKILGAREHTGGHE
jgi:glycerophosphoryl diester phosphodiesterase